MVVISCVPSVSLSVASPRVPTNRSGPTRSIRWATALRVLELFHTSLPLRHSSIP
jgi:hypothetical protein